MSLKYVTYKEVYRSKNLSEYHSKFKACRMILTIVDKIQYRCYVHLVSWQQTNNTDPASTCYRPTNFPYISFPCSRKRFLEETPFGGWSRDFFEQLDNTADQPHRPPLWSWTFISLTEENDFEIKNDILIPDTCWLNETIMAGKGFCVKIKLELHAVSITIEFQQSFNIQY